MTEIRDCDIIQDLLPGYADHILSASGTEAVENHLALDGFRKLQKRTQKLRLTAGITSGLLLFLLGGIFLSLFVIGRPVYPGAECSTVFDEGSESLTIEGTLENCNIGRVKWKRDEQDENIIYLLLYETSVFPFTPKKNDFSITIPNVKGCEVYQARPDYERTLIYSWEKEHYEKVEQLKEEIYRRIPALAEETDILDYNRGIDRVDGSEGLSFYVDYLLGENVSCWDWNDMLTTDGYLKSADFEIWISLDEPYRILIYDYRTGQWTEDYSIIEERRPDR